MKFTTEYADQSAEIIALFASTFIASEGAAEGQLIQKLATDMFATLDDRDMIVVCAQEGGALTGSIIFTRMIYAEDGRTVFILSPVAVATDHQRKGGGQSLLRHGLDVLRDAGVDVVLTYGDPIYYSKVGFAQITEEMAQAPFALSHPGGWLGQTLSGKPFEPLKGSSRCVAALSDPTYW